MARSEHSVVVGVFGLSVITALTAVILYTVLGLVGTTPISLPYQDQVGKVLRVGFTQGWGFFTRNPREEEFYIYGLGTRGWESAFRGPSANPVNAFGFDRFPRAQGLEFGLINQQVAQNAWVPCERQPADCLAATKAVIRVKNVSKHPLLCGSIGLVLRKTVPWAWARSQRPVIMPSHVVRVEASC